MNDKSTPKMRRNCGEHLRRAIEILEPTLIIGLGTGPWLQEMKLIPSGEELFPEGKGEISVKSLPIGGTTPLLIDLPHPSRQDPKGWGNAPWNDFLRDLVGPAIQRAVQVSFDIQ